MHRSSLFLRIVARRRERTTLEEKTEKVEENSAIRASVPQNIFRNLNFTLSERVHIPNFVGSDVKIFQKKKKLLLKIFTFRKIIHKAI